MNIINIAGTIGRDSELKFTSSGVAVARISVVTNYRWVKDGEKCEESEWHRCTLWGKRAEGLSPHLLKGGKVAISGRVKTTSYNDKDGIKRYSTEIIVSDVTLLGGSGGGGGGQRAQSQAPQEESHAPSPQFGGQDDDIPF
jgi:single-strand DNA-binding protein